MASPQAHSIEKRFPPAPAARGASSRWILSSRMDLLLFVATPLLIVPLTTLIQRPWIGIDVATITLVVSAFGELGHHLPGMIRAYGDRELFQRFRLRFIVAPLFLLIVCIVLSQHRLNSMLLVLSIWGCWHALMQVYGFVRIYDVKVGSVSRATANWDWLMCVAWFSTAQVFSSGKMSRLLEHWYDSGGPLIPPAYISAFRWLCLAVSVAVLIGFLVHHVRQTIRGPRPNSIKLLMLASGIGFWWVAMVGIDDILLGIALFEVFHDVQYLAIVWLYNCRRVNTNPDLGAFMKFVFRRGHGLLLFYIGLVFAYGLIGLAPRALESEELKMLIRGVVWASTILHFYFDGFIWKVRESSTRAGLGLADAQGATLHPSFVKGELIHLLKWSPLVAFLGWLTIAELYGSTLPPSGTEVRRWPYTTQLQRVQNIAAAIPGDWRAQRRAATTLSNSGRREEAVAFLKHALERHPDSFEGYEMLGEIQLLTRDFDAAAASYRSAIPCARTKEEQRSVHHRLGEILVEQKQFAAAEGEFEAALEMDSNFEPARRALRRLRELSAGAR